MMRGRLAHKSPVVDRKQLSYFAENAKALVSSKLFGVRFECHAKEDLLANDEAKALMREFRSACGDVATAFQLGFISSIRSPFGLFCMVHGHVVSQRLTNLSIVIQRQPSTPPPQSLADLNLKMGGYQRGWERLMRMIADQSVTCDVRLQLFLTKDFKPPLRLRQRKAISDRVFHLETEEYELTSKRAAGLDLVVAFRRGVPGPLLKIEHAQRVRFSNDFVEAQSDRLFKLCNSLFGSK
jgi:hypothetical protein